MSKIGRKSIDIGAVQVAINGQEIEYKGKKSSGTHVLPDVLHAELNGKNLKITAKEAVNNEANRLWGLHRALVSNKIIGADHGFEKQLRIVGLGFKAVLQGSKIQFSLGFSHKIDFALPTEVSVEVDKSGQLLTFKSSNKELLGQVCSNVRSLREPEPYKGTGIQYVNEVILRKAGKAKSA